MSDKDYLLINNYELKEDIGEGNFGKVKLGIYKKTGEEFAIKIINKDKIKKQMKNILFKENEIITKFNHINVVYVFQIIEDEKNIYIVMEYCNKGELFDYIVAHQKLDEDEASLFFYQLINGVDYIHKKGVAHRDLKPENLLLTLDKTLKIIDFGLSHEYDENSLLKTKCGSPSYAAPEIIKGKLYDGFKIDIWCCGIILYAMLCGYLPFEGNNNRELFANILECNPEYPSFLTKNSKKLIQNLLKINPDERLTIEQIKNNDFYLKGKELCKIDYKLIEDKLEKRNTLYGSGFKNFFNINKTNENNEKKKNKEYKDIDNIKLNKKYDKEDTLSKISDNSNRNKKLNLINLMTDNNNNLNNFRQKIMKNNYNFKKKIDLINDKIQQILQTDANDKNQNDLNYLKRINLFNHKNNNNDVLGKQNIYEERFQNKNTGCFLYLKKNNKNSIENTASNSHNKTKKFFTQFVTPTPLNKKMVSPFLNDYNKNYLNICKNTETINFDKHHNDFSLNTNNNSNIIRTRTINKNSIENSPIHANKNKDENQMKNKSVDQRNKNINYSNNKINSIRNNSNDIDKYYSYNKMPNTINYNQNNDNIVGNSVVNNINIIWENNSSVKRKKIRDNSPTTNKNYQKNENFLQIQKMLNKFNKDISKNEYMGIKTENKELFDNKNNIHSKNKTNRNYKNLNTIENNGISNKENIDKVKNKIFNYRSKSRDNGNNILKNIKEKIIDKNILPPLDFHRK